MGRPLINLMPKTSDSGKEAEAVTSRFGRAVDCSVVAATCVQENVILAIKGFTGKQLMRRNGDKGDIQCLYWLLPQLDQLQMHQLHGGRVEPKQNTRSGPWRRQ